MNDIPPRSAAVDRPTRFRWTIVGLLIVITLVNYADRSALSYAVPLIEKDLAIGPTDMGLILGAFGIGYVLANPVAGLLIDRLGVRLILTVTMVFWALTTGLVALATGFVLLYLARFALGLSEGASFPAVTGVVARWLPAHQRASAFGITVAAVPLSLAIGAPILTTLITSIGWRETYALIALATAVWVPVWWFCYRDDPARSPFVNEAEADLIAPHGAVTQARSGKASLGEDLAVLFGNRTVVATFWAYFVYGFFLFFYMTWLPDFLVRHYGFDLRQVGAFSVLPWTLAAIMIVVLGRTSDVLLARTGRLRIARSTLIWASQLLSAIATMPLLLSSDLWVAVASITLSVGFAIGGNAVYYSVLVDVVPHRAAFADGIMNTFFAAAGFVAPVLAGFVLETTGSFAFVFALMVALALSTVVVVLAIHRPDRDLTEPGRAALAARGLAAPEVLSAT